MNRRRVTFLLSTLVLLTATACGETSEGDGSPSAGGPAKAVSVADALGTDGAGPVRVRGALVFHGEVAQLCDALAESYPPQCVGGTTIQGFDASIIPPGAGNEGRIRWVDSIELIVTREDGNLRYVSTADTA